MPWNSKMWYKMSVINKLQYIQNTCKKFLRTQFNLSLKIYPYHRVEPCINVCQHGLIMCICFCFVFCILRPVSTTCNNSIQFWWGIRVIKMCSFIVTETRMQLSPTSLCRSVQKSLRQALYNSKCVQFLKIKAWCIQL